jgi:succinoglycan biosynthesis transport protein ExoP
VNQMLELEDVVEGILRRWWILLVLALCGIGIGLMAAQNISPVYRSQSTVLVGPTNGTVTHSTTIRASESLAAFYADLARRQIILGPVIERLHLQTTWEVLRTRVSAAVPSQNMRLVTVTVTGSTSREASLIAGEIVDQLVSLSPHRAGGSQELFVSEQAADLKDMIQRGEQQVRTLQTQFEQTTDRDQRDELRRELAFRQGILNDWRHTYVELMAVELNGGAGALQVLDPVTSVTDMDRGGLLKQALVGGLVGGVLGVTIASLLHRRDRRRREVSPVAHRESPVAHRESPVETPGESPMSAPPGTGLGDASPPGARLTEDPVLSPVARNGPVGRNGAVTRVRSSTRSSNPRGSSKR